LQLALAQPTRGRINRSLRMAEDGNQGDFGAPTTLTDGPFAGWMT
jgi:hypothetical protein